MTLTEEELQRIVARAVKVALEEIVGEEDSATSDVKQPAEGVVVRPFDDDQLEEAMNLMSANRGKDNEPKVGIFWFDVQKKNSLAFARIECRTT